MNPDTGEIRQFASRDEIPDGWIELDNREARRLQKVDPGERLRRLDQERVRRALEKHQARKARRRANSSRAKNRAR